MPEARPEEGPPGNRSPAADEAGDLVHDKREEVEVSTTIK